MAFSDDHDLLESMHSKLTEAWEQLNGIWNKVGYDEDSLFRRRNIVKKHFNELLDEMCQEAASKLEDQQNTLKGLMQEIEGLAKDLSIDQVPELESAAGKPLLEMERIFLVVVEGLRKQKAKRMEKYDIINAEVIEISDELDETPMQIEFKGIPADSQVNTLEHHLIKLRHEKGLRLQQFHSYKRSIIELFEFLEKTPKTDLELLIVESDEIIDSKNTTSADGLKLLSTETLKALEEIRGSLIRQVEENNQQGEFMWGKIRELWSKLSADEEMMSIFSQVHRPISSSNWKEIYKPSVLKGLQKELERLEEEKLKNMSHFIKQCREQLCDLWLNKCFMTSVQDRFLEPNYAGLTGFAIGDFTEEECTEELLEKHEREIEFWQGFIERNKRIIDGVIKRGEMFGQYKILDQKSDDPSRLANRGGALLKEEKERKKLEKAIPKLENELKQLCDEFESEEDGGHGMKKFLVYGRTIYEMIEQDWEQFTEEKRLRKEAKKKPNEAAGGNKTLMTTQLGNPGTRKRPATPSSAQRGALTPVKRNRTTALTPGKTIQSPFLQPSVSGAPSNSVKRPLTSKDNFVQPRSAKKTPTNKSGGALSRQQSAGKLPLPTKLTGKEQVPPSCNTKNSKDSIISPVASYSEFTDHLLCQSTLNSSAVVPIQKQGPGTSGTAPTPTTPTKSGMALAPAKLPLTDNCF